MIIPSIINKKVGLLSGILIGALIVAATSQICQNRRCTKQPVNAADNSHDDED